MKKTKLANAMNHIDDDLIVSANRKKVGKPVWMRWAAAAAVFIFVFSAVFATAGAVGASKVDAVVAFDVNPSIELEINKKEQVVEVNALNEEAKTVLADMDLRRVDINVAVNAIVGSMLKNGYLSVNQNSILISVDAKDKARAEALQTQISNDIESILGTASIEASVMAQSFEKDETTVIKAEENHISAAKATLIDKIVAAGLTDAEGLPYSYETLAHMKVNELKMLLESKEVQLEGVKASGTAKDESYIGKEAAISLALVHAGLAKDSSDASPYAQIRKLHVELDFEDGIMIYDVEFETDETEYEYEIHAKTGEILKSEKEINDDRGGREDKDNKSDDGGKSEESVSYIGEDKALKAALSHAGLTADAVREIETELDRENGVTVYKVEFETDETEYDYEIHATTGEILKAEKETNDDLHAFEDDFDDRYDDEDDD